MGENTQNSDRTGALPPFKVDMCLICICVINLFSNSGYGLIAPFLPQELKQKGIAEQYYGYIFGIYSVAVIICSPIVGYLLLKF